VFDDTFNNTKILNHISAVVIQVPELAIMTLMRVLMRPPESGCSSISGTT
jgi:hypothetical protein